MDRPPSRGRSVAVPVQPDVDAGIRGASVKIFFDGGCRPNPGPMHIAVVARGVVHHVANLGRGSSEQAEWLALLHGLHVAQTIGERDIILLGDAAGVIAQAKGNAKCRQLACLEQFQQQVATFERVRLRHVRRNQNLAGIALAKIAASVVPVAGRE